MRVLEKIKDFKNRSRFDSSMSAARLEFGLARGFENDFLADTNILAL